MSFGLKDVIWLTRLPVHGHSLTGETFVDYFDIYQRMLGEDLPWTKEQKATYFLVVQFAWGHMAGRLAEEHSDAVTHTASLVIFWYFSNNYLFAMSAQRLYLFFLLILELFDGFHTDS